MDQFIPELPQIEASNGGPWLWQVRRFQDDGVVMVEENANIKNPKKDIGTFERSNGRH
jgi:hypothetical protein